MREPKQEPPEVCKTQTPLPSPLSSLPSLVIFLAIWLFLLLAGRETMFRDPGTFWHVAAGENMLTTGEVVRRDPFSFTRADQPWVADQWLPECGMAAVFGLAGWDGLLLLTAVALAGIYAWIAARLMRGGLHFIPVCLLLSVAIMLGSPQFLVRPLVLSIGLLGITFACLIDVESGKKTTRSLWWLVPLFVLWSNVHGGVLGGLGTVGLWTIGMIACDISARRIRNAVQLIIFLFVLSATILISPYGIDLPRHWLITLRMPLSSLIEEHASLNLSEPIGWVTVALAVLYAIALLGVFPRRPRIIWLIPLVWFVLATMRCRNASLFAVTAALALADMLPYSRAGNCLRRRGLLGDIRLPAGPRAAILPVLIVAVAMAAYIFGVGRPLARLDRDRCPVELLPQLDEISRSNEDGVRIFNDLNFGGFLIFHEPRMRIFIDDRCALYGADFLQEYDRVRREEPAQIDQWRRLHGFRYALVETGDNFDRYLRSSADWEVLGASPAATLFKYRLGD